MALDPGPIVIASHNRGKIREIEPIRIHVLKDKLVMEPQPDKRVSLELIP